MFSITRFIFVLFTVCILGGCTQKSPSDGRVCYKNMDTAIQNGLKNEGLTQSDVLGEEVDQGNTLVFFQKGPQVGVASISTSNKGYSWYRSTPYTSLQMNDEPFGSISFDVVSENMNVSKAVTGVINNKAVKEVDLYVKGSLVESKSVSMNHDVFYFLVRDSTASATSIEVKAR